MRASDSWMLVAQMQHHTEPDHEDFATYGTFLAATLQALENLTRVLETQVRDYPRNRILSDAQDRDPIYRIIDSVAQLHILHSDLAHARRAATAFGSLISHLRVDLEF